jgi:hypothetical protein
VQWLWSFDNGGNRYGDGLSWRFMSIDAIYVVRLKTLQRQWVKSTSSLIATIAQSSCQESGNLTQSISRARAGGINEH